MIIKKIDEDITYKAETVELVVEVNGKKVHITDWYKSDNAFSDYDADVEIDESDRESLTEEEDEALTDHLTDLKALKIGETINTEDNG